MTNLDDSTGHSPEEFEQWFTNLPPAAQQEYMNRWTRLGVVTEYERLIEQHGPIESTASDDFDTDITPKDADRLLVMQIISDTTDLPYRNAMELAERIVDGLEEEHRPDEELDDFEYYGRHGYSRTAPVCTDPDCPCED